MFGSMHQAANYRRRQLRAPHSAEVAKRFYRNGSKLCHRCINLRCKRFHHGRDIAVAQLIALLSHRDELFWGKGVATRIREKAIDHTLNVSYMKSRRGNTTRASVPFVYR